LAKNTQGKEGVQVKDIYYFFVGVIIFATSPIWGIAMLVAGLVKLMYEAGKEFVEHK
jgi:hypothetical protein